MSMTVFPIPLKQSTNAMKFRIALAYIPLVPGRSKWYLHVVPCCRYIRASKAHFCLYVECFFCCFVNAMKTFGVMICHWMQWRSTLEVIVTQTISKYIKIHAVQYIALAIYIRCVGLSALREVQRLIGSDRRQTGVWAIFEIDLITDVPSWLH